MKSNENSRFVLLVTPLAMACTSWPETDSSRVETGAILGVVADPPEQRPGQVVAFRVFAGDEEGSVQEFEVRATYCLTPKPLMENNSVSQGCLTEPGQELASEDGSFSGAVPMNACALFGPESPPGDSRPRDPDATFGYYAPVRWDAFGGTSIFLERIRCTPKNVGIETTNEYLKRYVPNTNPSSLRLEATPTSGGFRIMARLDGTDAENFVVIDPVSNEVVERREELSGTWFVSGGTLTGDNGLFEGPHEWTTTAVATPNKEGAPWTVFMLVRDSRGGTAFAALRLGD